MNSAKQILDRFHLDAKVTDLRKHGEGLINDTFEVRTENRRYILQRKNRKIFTDIPRMMENIIACTSHLSAKAKSRGLDPEKSVLQVICASDGKPYAQDKDGEYWVLTHFIENSISYDSMSDTELARKGGEGLGAFHRDMGDFKQELFAVIPGFHNIRYRFEQWDNALRDDAAGRVGSLAEEISWIESRREQMLAFWEKVERGEIPQRVTHNDTKISNFLFREDTGDFLCAIDLDTLMTSTLLNDFGDAMRSSANTGAEDDTSLDRVSFNREIFEAYADGYLSQMAGVLAPPELENLAFSALYITYEQVLRFLMDYIMGDTYYRIKYPEHNLVRTRAQHRLLESMEASYRWMQQTVENLQHRYTSHTQSKE